MARKRPSSYAWARHVRALAVDRRLSAEGWEGLEYAEQLTEAAAYRGEMALRGERVPPMTIDELAVQYGVSAATVRRRIARARQEAFGSLSDAGIYYRLRTQRERKERPARGCQQPGCSTPIPRTAPAHRRYCDAHSSPSARVRRHRTKAPDAS